MAPISLGEVEGCFARSRKAFSRASVEGGSEVQPLPNRARDPAVRDIHHFLFIRRQGRFVKLNGCSYSIQTGIVSVAARSGQHRIRCVRRAEADMRRLSAPSVAGALKAASATGLRQVVLEDEFFPIFVFHQRRPFPPVEQLAGRVVADADEAGRPHDKKGKSGSASGIDLEMFQVQGSVSQTAGIFRTDGAVPPSQGKGVFHNAGNGADLFCRQV